MSTAGMKIHSFLDHLGRIRLNSIGPCCCVLPNDKDYANYTVFSGRPHQALCSSLFLTEASPTRRCCSSSLVRVILMVQGQRGVSNPMLSHQSRRVLKCIPWLLRSCGDCTMCCKDSDFLILKKSLSWQAIFTG